MKSKLLTIFLAAILTVTLSLGLASCKKNKLELSETEVSIAEGTSKTITVNYDGDEAIAWSNSNNSVVTITAVGKNCIIRGIAQGTSTVTATAGKMTGECVVTVTEAPEVEVVTIYKDGVAVSGPISVEEGGTVNLTATASMGSSISWTSSDETKATVSNGTVSALMPGDVEITAMVDASIKATVTIHITAHAGSVYYDLPFGKDGNPETEDGQEIPHGKFYYWSARAEWSQQQVDVEQAYYRDGAVSIKYTSNWVSDPENPNVNGGYFYGFQLKYWNDDLTHQHYYKFTCKFTIDQDCFVSIAGTVVELKKGTNDVTVYYYFDANNAFQIMMGYDMMNKTNGYFVKDADFTISDMNWTDDTSTRVQLKTPSFTYAEDTGVITITDSNTEGVGRYALNFYDDAEKCVSTVTVKSGEAVNTSRVPNGTYTAKLVAVAENAHYIDSAESESTATITVENESIEYELEATGIGGAVSNPGTWSYWAQSWVKINTGLFKDGVVTFDYTNNAGNWDDTQLYYRHPDAETGKIYRVKLTINSNSAGHITISRSEVEILVGEHEYTIENVEHRADSATVAIIFALYGQTNVQEIKNGHFEFSNVTIEETGVIEDQPGNPDTPDTTANPDDYTLGEKLDPSTNAMNKGGETEAVANTMTYWYLEQYDWGGDPVTMNKAEYANGTVHFKYTGGSIDFSVQLFYKNSQLQAGKKYFVFVTIKVDKDLQIKLNGTIMNLTAGTHTLAVMFDGADTDLSIQLYGVGSNTVDVTISDISWQEVLSKK